MSSLSDHTDQKLENAKLVLKRADPCLEQSNNWLKIVNFQPARTDLRLEMIRFET